MAANRGHLECLRYAHEHGCPWDIETTWIAAKRRHLECLRYAHEHGCPWDEEICWMAALDGNLECLKYAHEHGCPWDKETCRWAASSGHLECLKYAHEHGCPWDEETCRSAATYGHLECLQYAHSKGCPWNVETCTGYLDKIQEYIQFAWVVERALRQGTFLLVNLSDPAVQQIDQMKPIVDAGRVIVKAAERAYFDPRYSWCRRRLRKSWDEMIQELETRQR
jgi:hypothetical protein